MKTESIKTRWTPFPKAYSRYGAQMGRHGDNPSNFQALTEKERAKIKARHQGGCDGYDMGGAYWGYPSDVYAVHAMLGKERICTYVRAKSKEHAIAQVLIGER